MIRKTTLKGKKLASKSHATPKKKTSFSWDPRTWYLAPLATLGPIGYFPKVPGTIGSLVALPIAYVLHMLAYPLLWMFVFILFVVGLRAIQQYTADKTEKDPSCVIIDEVVGQLIPFMIIIPDFMHWPMLFLGFALFRFFDIFKFGAVAFWDRRKNPMGVMMDDVTAGIFAGFILSMVQVVLVGIFGL